MASMRKLRRRLAAWERYDTRNQAIAGGWACATLLPGLNRARDDVRHEKWRRGLLSGQRYTPNCYGCGLPDSYRGRGDGIGSCDCPRCPSCGAGPELCDCRDDGMWCCGGANCMGECGDDEYLQWPDDVFRPVETATVVGGVL